MAGVPLEFVENLATRATAEAARQLLVRQSEFAQAKSDVEALLQSRQHGLSEELFRAWRRAIRSGQMPPPADPASQAFAQCWQCAADVATAESLLQQTLQREVEVARAALFEAARKALPLYLVFAAEGVRDRLIKQLACPALPLEPRHKQTKADERHLLLYLQRVCAKNDSLSAFGPEGWGTIEAKSFGVRFSPRPGIAQRETFLERWAAHGVAAALNADPKIRAEVAPRLHPYGRIEGDQFVFTDTGEKIALDSETIDILAACDAKTPAWSLGIEMEILERLTRQNLLRWEVEVPAFEPQAFEVLVSDVLRWRDGPARTHWLALLQPLAELPAKLAETTETQARLAMVEEATARLDQLGARKTGTRFLYSAANPIGEECFRECGFSISESLINEVAVEAAPWIDLWRDAYAFIASRVAAGLRSLLEQAPLQNGALPLPAFLRHCASLKMSLTGPGMVAFAHLAFQEIKAAFRELMRERAAAPECELTMEDCQFVRRNFQYPKFDEYTYPSADLQLGAKSVEAVGHGEYQWVLAELHPPAALLHHGFYWSCPDKAALSTALTSILFEQPSFQFGFFAADFTATTAVRLFDALPELTYFVAAQRGNPKWRVLPPAQTEVFVEESSGDVCLRQRDSHQYLGSFARGWVIPLGFHPFSFSLGQHTPRLRCGKVVVQRRSWTIALDELGEGNFTGISRDLVTAVERLRETRSLPRYVYIRPTEQSLRRSGAEGRDKDTKPVFLDLESYLFLEIFHRWLVKAGELEVTEMLPTPDQLLWREADGRRTFELRTLIVPR